MNLYRRYDLALDVCNFYKYSQAFNIYTCLISVYEMTYFEPADDILDNKYKYDIRLAHMIYNTFVFGNLF